MRLQFSLLPRFTLAFALFAALLLIAFGTLVYIRAQQVLQQSATSELLADILEKESAVSNWVNNGQRGLDILAESLDNNGALAVLNGVAPDSADARSAHLRLVTELQERQLHAAIGHRRQRRQGDWLKRCDRRGQVQRRCPLFPTWTDRAISPATPVLASAASARHHDRAPTRFA